jgi:hypothetical protein
MSGRQAAPYLCPELSDLENVLGNPSNHFMLRRRLGFGVVGGVPGSEKGKDQSMPSTRAAMSGCSVDGEEGSGYKENIVLKMRITQTRIRLTDKVIAGEVLVRKGFDDVATWFMLGIPCFRFRNSSAGPQNVIFLDSGGQLGLVECLWRLRKH